MFEWKEQSEISVLEVDEITLFVHPHQDPARNCWLAKTEPFLFSHFLVDLKDMTRDEAKEEAIERLRTALRRSLDILEGTNTARQRCDLCTRTFIPGEAEKRRVVEDSQGNAIVIGVCVKCQEKGYLPGIAWDLVCEKCARVASAGETFHPFGSGRDLENLCGRCYEIRLKETKG